MIKQYLKENLLLVFLQQTFTTDLKEDRSTITDFNLTPNNIVKLSKFNSQNESKDQYNRSIFPKRNTSIFKSN